MDSFQVKKWEVSITEFLGEDGKVYKVTRRIPEFGVAETKIVKDKKEAKELLQEWLKEPFEV